MIFLDSNVIIDLVERVGKWSGWSRAVVAALEEQLVCNPVVLAETAPRFASAAEQIRYMDDIHVTVLPIDPVAAFRAGRAHHHYRRRGGARDAVVADFLIGAHAEMLGATLITRDRARFATYFPDLSLITPETHP